MEPLLEQADHFNVTQRVNNNLDHSSSIPSSLQVIHSGSHQNNILIESPNSLQTNDLQVSSYTTSSTSSSSSSNENILLQVRGHPNNGRSPPPPLTSQDIAALRKTLSGRPKLRRVCHICGRECPSRHKLQRHLSTHSEERPYHCKICGKAFKWTEYLSKHMRTQHGPGSSNVVKRHITIRSTGSTGSISSNEDLATTAPTTPIANSSTLRSTPEAVAISQNKTAAVTSGTSTSSGTGYVSNSAINQNQSSPAADVFSPQSAYDGMLLTESVNSSTPLLSSQSAPVMSNQLTPTYSGGYFPTGFSYPPLFPMNCYGYPHPPTHMDVMGQYTMPPNGYNSMYPPANSFDPNYQNYLRPQPQEIDQGQHSNHTVSTTIVTTSADHTTTNTLSRDTLTSSSIPTSSSSSFSFSSSSSVSCQTQECQDIIEGTTTTNRGKPPVVIINLCTKKDVGIQCEVGDETLQALFEEEDQLSGAISSVNGGFDSNSSMDTSDEGLSSVCKYPCEYEGCGRSYIHRKDLIRHMKSAHSTIPRLLQPKVVETPTKPFICQVSDCGKSYYHLKDLRRHQRQCHLVGLSVLENGTSAQLEAVLDDVSSLRYPCDFKGCTKSYIHKKDLIRHKRTYHQDNSSHPSIPEPVIVIHVKKGGKERSNDDGEDEDEGRRLPVKRFRLDSSSEPLNIAQLPVSNQQPVHAIGEERGNTADLSSLNPSNIMDNISAIFDMERSPLNIFPVDSLTATPISTSISTSSSANLAVSVTSTGEDDIMTSNCNNIYATPTSSPSALFMTLLSQNI